MKKLFFSLGMILLLNIHAQKTYKFPQDFNPYYDFKPMEAYEKLIKEPASEEHKKKLKSFAEGYIFTEQFMFDNNQVYMDWGEVEVYLLKILHKILPKESNKKNLDLFLSRSLLRNASASRFGNIFFNLGMLASSENEAFIAAVLAHEAGHYFLGHGLKEVEKYGVITEYVGWRNEELKSFLELRRKNEMQADSFAVSCLKKAGINLIPLLDYHEENDVMEQYSRSYKSMVKASSLSQEEYKKRKKEVYNPYSTHPAAVERYNYIKSKIDSSENRGANFFVDSVFLKRLQRFARDEIKKIALEEFRLAQCMEYSFIEYMYEPKNLKNLYFLIEATRRTMYVRPDLKEKGFLSEEVDDDFLYYHNKSILHKPQFLFNTYRQFSDLKDHEFVKAEKKPFETYEQAFLYFTEKALKLNFNEANFSLALYYYSISEKDSVTKYLERYVNSGSGLYINYAEALLKKEKAFSNKAKMLIVYNNISSYTYRNFVFYDKVYTRLDFNYYQTIKRKKYNSSVREKFGKDTSNVALVLVNELLGKRPYQLYEIQKLMNSLFTLYNEDDIEACKKIRLTSHFAGEDNEISQRSKKELFIYAPEWYNWFKENNYSKLFLVDIVYQYKQPMEAEESFNTYTGYYLDMNQKRPYFRDASRTGFNIKPKEKEIHDELYSFLYEK